jgi:hypothetical protein
MKEHQLLIRNVLISYAASLVGGLIALILGSLYGGNYATEFVFAGLQGYEATGVLFGVIGGCLAGAFTYLKLIGAKTKNANTSRRISLSLFETLVAVFLVHLSSGGAMVFVALALPILVNVWFYEKQ